MAVGKRLGLLLYHALLSRRRVTLTNLELAYPDKPEADRARIAKDMFQHLGLAIAETAWLWYRWPDAMGHIDIEGEEYVDAALAAGKGVILLQAHFTVLELCGAVVGSRWPVHAVYDDPKNPLFAACLLKQRSRHLSGLINNKGIREMVRCLRRGEMVWYSPDQTVSAKHGGVSTRYFDQPVLSTSGTARIVAMTGAAVIPFIPKRHGNGQRYTFTFKPALTLDTDDPVKATQQVNDQLESDVRTQVEQYLWAHKRFKPPSTDFPNPYA